MLPAIPEEVKDINVQNFPRLLVVAEIGWIAEKERDYPDFQNRLETHYPRLDELKIDYYRKGGYITEKWEPDKFIFFDSKIEWDITKKAYATE